MSYLVVIKGSGEEIKRGKKVLERNKHCPLANKCHSSGSIQAGVCPLDINFKA